MASHLPPDAEVAGWLHTLGIVSLCQWDVLVFLSRHQTTLLGTASLAQLLGYATESIVAALESLESLALVTRSRVSQGARLYQCMIPHTSPRGEAFARLQALADHRAGRVLVATAVAAAGPPPRGGAPRRPNATATTLSRASIRSGAQAHAHEERRHRWLQAI